MADKSNEAAVKAALDEQVKIRKEEGRKVVEERRANEKAREEANKDSGRKEEAK